MKVKFKKGLSSNLPTQLNSGTTYLTTDKPNFIFDLDNNRFSLLPLFDSGNNNHVLSIQTGGKLSWWDNYEKFDVNQIPISIDTDGSIFNNGKGYILDYRLSSSGDLKAQPGALATGYMAIQPNQEIYMNGADMMAPPWDEVDFTYTYIIFYDKNFNKIETCNWQGTNGLQGSKHYVSNTSKGYIDKTNTYYEINENGLIHFVINWSTPQEYAYVRLSVDISENSDANALIFFVN